MNKNKNFRKSAIVIPALALMVLTAAAGTTGAVAWFTANRAATANVSTFTASAASNSLTITAAGITGTVANATTTSAVDIKDTADATSNYLRDASYDANNKNLYRANFNDDNVSSNVSPAPTGFTVVTEYDTHGTTDGHKIYYAVSWKYTFTCSNIDTTNGTALFFDPAGSKFENKAKTDNVAKGLRIAMNTYTKGTTGKDTPSSAEVNTTNGYIVLGADSTKTYVGATASQYTSDNLTYDDYGDYFFTASAAHTKASDGLTATQAATDHTYIGYFKANTDSITVTCTAWYEGSDADVITSNLVTDEAITATLSFYVRDLKASA